MIEARAPKEGAFGYRFCAWFIKYMNFCHGYTLDGTPKPENGLYNWFYAHWLWPFVQNDCVCCNAVRGLFYGLLIGFLLGRI